MPLVLEEELKEAGCAISSPRLPFPCVGGLPGVFKCHQSQMFTTTAKMPTKPITLKIASGHESKGHEQSCSG